ncbi:hypothetical protein ACFU53_05010 [Streptomyces sp. NPDC057474]|uniref:hypothetical protein n=1 Tax=Streptomyces sp. NPDC057474 TaxID=3346144 RepID=UPI003686A485
MPPPRSTTLYVTALTPLLRPRQGADVPAKGMELLTGTPVEGTATVPLGGGVAVIREPR